MNLLSCGRRVFGCVIGIALGAPGWALAQPPPPPPPGPFVIDVRAATMGLPKNAEFYPPLPADALVPARGFGIDVGAHVYFTLGAARLGAGGGFAYLRGATSDTSLTTRLIAPQLSFNFGTANGWSYLSGGAGAADVRAELVATPEREAGVHRSGMVLAINGGGGARWFVTSHLAVGFDLRLHWIQSGGGVEGAPGTPSATMFLASAGLSLK